MSQIIGSICGYCNRPLKETDDIVVCPICGTPHHRECYFQHNACFNESLHDSGFVYERPVPAQDGTVICSQCGRTLSPECDFCNYCGAPVDKVKTEPLSVQPVFMLGTRLFQGQSARNDLEEDLDGIPVKYWVSYIGTNYNYYLNIFKLQDTAKKKTSFTLSAVLFPFLYFLYRRIWGAAVISALTSLILSFPGFVVMYLAPQGINLGMNIVTLDRLSSVFSILNVFINLGWGIFAAWLYRKRSGTRMKRIKEGSSNEAEFLSKLKDRSGASIASVIIGVTALTMIIFIVSLVTGIFDNISFL